MHCAVLTIGSLLWDKLKYRPQWRADRLETESRIHIKVPIVYGRRSNSRGNTYTMIFDPDAPQGQAVLLPCKSEVVNFEDLIREALELWKAEDPQAFGENDLGKSWGCVGAMFGDRVSEDFRDQWSDIFRNKTVTPVEPVNQGGVLEILWPCYLDGEPVDYDIILATSNKGVKQRLSPEEIADAWIKKGHEEYFFNNIREGIRTHEDLAIWRRFDAKQPPWLGKTEYSTAVKILKGESEQKNNR